MDKAIELLRILDFEKTSKIILTKDIFDVPNQVAFQATVHFVLCLLDPVKAEEAFRNCWPVVNAKGSADFRKEVFNFLSSLPKEQNFKVPTNLKSLLLSPHGPRFTAFFVYLTKHAVQVSLGFSASEHPATVKTLQAATSVNVQDIKHLKNESAIEECRFTDCMNKHSITIQKLEANIQLLEFQTEQKKKIYSKKQKCTSPDDIKERLEELRELWRKFDAESKEWNQMWGNVSYLLSPEDDTCTLDGCEIVAQLTGISSTLVKDASLVEVADADGNLDVLKFMTTFKEILTELVAEARLNPVQAEEQVSLLESHGHKHVSILEKLETLCSNLQEKLQHLRNVNKMLWTRQKARSSFSAEREVFSFPPLPQPVSNASAEDRVLSNKAMADMLDSALGIVLVPPPEASAGNHNSQDATLLTTPHVIRKNRRAVSPLINDPLALPVDVTYSANGRDDPHPDSRSTRMISGTTRLEISKTGNRQNTKVCRPGAATSHLPVPMMKRYAKRDQKTPIISNIESIPQSQASCATGKSDARNVVSRFNAVKERVIDCIVEAVLSDRETDNTDLDILEDPLKALDPGAFKSKDRLARTPTHDSFMTTGSTNLEESMITAPYEARPISSNTSTPCPLSHPDTCSSANLKMDLATPDVSQILSHSRLAFEQPTLSLVTPSLLDEHAQMFPPSRDKFHLSGSPELNRFSARSVADDATTVADVGGSFEDGVTAVAPPHHSKFSSRLRTENNNNNLFHDSFGETMETIRDGDKSSNSAANIDRATPGVRGVKLHDINDVIWDDVFDDKICDEGCSFLLPNSPDVSTLTDN